MGVLSNGEFALWGGLSSREFVVWEFCPVENLSCGNFVRWRIGRVGVLSNGEFAVCGGVDQ